MKRLRFTETQIVSILSEADAGMKVQELCHKHGISPATYYSWKSKYGGLKIDQAKRLKELSHRVSRILIPELEALGHQFAAENLTERDYSALADALTEQLEAVEHSHRECGR